MYAIRQYEFGGPEQLRYEEVPDPEPGPGQLRIRVQASGVHLIDTVVRAGSDGAPGPRPQLPMTPGREVAGVVDALGPDVEPKWFGRRVVAHLGLASAGYAELAVREVEAVHELPEGLDFAAATAMIGTGRTALAVLHVAALRAGDVTVVTAAAGGLGSLLVQAARDVGAFVVGLAGGPAKTKSVRDIGAGVAVDYREPDWPDQVRQALRQREVTVVFDGVGGAAGRDAMELLSPGGRLVIYGWSAGEPTVLSSLDLVRHGISATSALGGHVISAAGGLRYLEGEALAAAASGRLVPRLQSFPLSQAAAAHAALEGRNTVGKVVLSP